MCVTDPSPGTRAVVAYEIDDVVLIECSAKLAQTSIQPRFLKKAQFAHRTWIDGEVLSQDRFLWQPANNITCCGIF